MVGASGLVCLDKDMLPPLWLSALLLGVVPRLVIRIQPLQGAYVTTKSPGRNRQALLTEGGWARSDGSGEPGALSRFTGPRRRSSAEDSVGRWLVAPPLIESGRRSALAGIPRL